MQGLPLQWCFINTWQILSAHDVSTSLITLTLPSLVLKPTRKGKYDHFSNCPKSRVSWYRICLPCRRSGFDPGSGKYPGEANGNPLQYSCLENPTDRGLATVHGVGRVGHDLVTTTKVIQLLAESFDSALCHQVHFYKTHLFSGEWSGNPLPYSCLENPMDRRAWGSMVHGVTWSWTWLRLIMRTRIPLLSHKSFPCKLNTVVTKFILGCYNLKRIQSRTPNPSSFLNSFSIYWTLIYGAVFWKALRWCRETNRSLSSWSSQSREGDTITKHIF